MNEDLLKEIESLTPEELSELSDQELSEIENFMSQRQEPEVETSPFEAGFRGSAQEFTYGFSDEIEAGVDTVIDQFKGNSELSFSDNLEENLKAARLENQMAEEKHGDAFFKGRMAGIAASMLTGGAAARATGLAITGAKAAAKMGAAQAALHSIGVSEDKLSGMSLANAAAAAGLGVAGGVTGHKVGEAAAKYFGPMLQGSKKLQKTIKKKIWDSLGLSSPKARQDLSDEMSKQGKTAAQWWDTIADEKVIQEVTEKGEIIYTNTPLARFVDSQENILEKIPLNLHKYEESRKATMGGIDMGDPRELVNQVRRKMMASIPKINQSEGNMKMVSNLLHEMETGIFEPVMDNMGKKVLNEAGEVIMRPKQKFTIHDAYLLRKGIDDTIGSWDKGGMSFKKKLSKTMRNAVNDFIDNAADKNLKGTNLTADKVLRPKIQSLNTLKDSLTSSLSKKSSEYGMLTDIVTTALPTSAIYAVTGDYRTASQIGLGVAVLRKVATSPKVSRHVATKLAKLANIAEKSGSHSSIMRKITASAAAGPDTLEGTVNFFLGQEALASDPIQRSYADVVNKQSAILDVAKEEYPELAENLEKSIEENDQETISALMDRLSKQPGLKKFFVDGTGFDGRIYDPADADQLNREVDSLDIPHIDRLRAKSQIRKGIVPKIQASPMPEKEEYNKRRRNLY